MPDDDARRASTTLLVLVTLRAAHPDPLSTYELGLAVRDDRDPPRPLSVLIKTLSKDKYIERAGLAGRRAGYWTITRRGLSSLERRSDAAAEAERWLNGHQNYTMAERAVAASLLENGPQPASRLTETCSLLHSPVRTALKRLEMRGLVRHPRPPEAEYRLTTRGRAIVRERLREHEA